MIRNRRSLDRAIIAAPIAAVPLLALVRPEGPPMCPVALLTGTA